ncbi:GLRX1 protein, partial [Oceanites oceanicus]|nr:GLRX1 protein [Oceanites oceanicus]
MAGTFVESRLRSDGVTLFVKAGCPYCRDAMEVLKEYNFVPGGLQVFDITGMEDVQDYLQQRTGQRTVPRVFLGRHCIGGASDLQKMRWQLPSMLRQIGALQ